MVDAIDPRLQGLYSLLNGDLLTRGSGIAVVHQMSSSELVNRG